MPKKSTKTAEFRSHGIAMRNAATGRFLSQKAVHTVQSGLKESTVKGMAVRVTGDLQAAERWYSRPNDLLGGRTPKEAVKAGDQDKVVGLLLNAAGQ